MPGALDASRALPPPMLTLRQATTYVSAITTGMRQGELLALRWRNVDLDGARWHVRSTLYRTTNGPATKGMADKGLTLGSLKTHKGRRQMALTSDAVAPLRRRRIRQLEERLAVGEARNHQDLVFPSHVGRPIETSNLIKRSYKLLLEKGGLPNIRFHDVRHTAATLFLRKKVPAKVVSEMLGHSQVGITLKIYSHVLPDMQREATAAMEATISG